MFMVNVLPEIRSSNDKSKWIHETVDSNKGNNCQICSLKIDLLSVFMNDAKKMNTEFSCVPQY